ERQVTLQHLDEAVAAGARLERACDLLGIDPRTVQRWRAQDVGDDRRAGPLQSPSNRLSDGERARVLEIANAPEHRDLSPKQIVPALADKGEYVASESTFYRVLREEQQLEPRETSRPPAAKPKEHVATGPNQVWSWDITPLRSLVRGVFFRLYLIIDIWDRSVVGWEIHADELGSHAADLLNETCMRADVRAGELVVHQDNGAPMISWEFLSALGSWGRPSYSRPGVCDDNPYSESMFRTLKYRPGYPRAFKTIDDARAWVAEFVDWYNNHHRHSAIGYVTPMQRRHGRDHDVLDVRRATYAAAHAEHPERWSRKPRKWDRPELVSLNPAHGRRSRQQKAA
ncbi:MAG: IS3 family transposase, partial [Leptospiraceae bacterium]|nr:IS3 family transposase [Leptospiraceae bacterium]